MVNSVDKFWRLRSVSIPMQIADFNFQVLNALLQFKTCRRKEIKRETQFGKREESVLLRHFF